MTTAQYMAIEVSWYRRHGKWPDRIVRDLGGREYVIGDFSWNRNRNNKDREEYIERSIPTAKQ